MPNPKARCTFHHQTWPAIQAEATLSTLVLLQNHWSIFAKRKEGERKVYPEYYVFNTKKDQNGNEIINPETGSAEEVDVTPGYLKLLDWILKNSKYIFLVFVLLLVAFAFTPKRKFNILAIIPSLLPFYFMAVFAYSLYWYGHHLDLHGGGAFSGIKPFMPTFFGHGKVAQFETIAYPYYGFFIAVLAFVAIILAILFKRKAISLGKDN